MKNIYCLMTEDGKVTPEVLELIRKNLVNQLAKDNLGRALKHCRQELNRAHIYVCAYGGVDIYAVRSWSTTARNTSLKVQFLNQEEHDRDGYDKLLSLK